MAADTVEARDNWKGALLRAGVFPDKVEQNTEEDKVGTRFPLSYFFVWISSKNKASKMLI